MLRYIGKGFMVGIPARDLREEEVEVYGGVKFLVGTGLWEKAEGGEKIATADEEQEHPPRNDKLTGSRKIQGIPSKAAGTRVTAMTKKSREKQVKEEENGRD